MNCKKCGYQSDDLRQKFETYLCNICFHLSPGGKEAFLSYVSESVDSSYLNSFRKYFRPGEKQKTGMIKKAIKGNPMSRAPFGYELIEGKLNPSQNSKEVEEIFEKFLHEKLSLRQIASKHKLSVNGLKKILRNFTYIGKIRFNHEVYEGTHKPILSSTLFNHVQNRLDQKRIK